jgi:two-component system, cell cycle sensor histidine kinase and response regulator CckA
MHSHGFLSSTHNMVNNHQQYILKEEIGGTEKILIVEDELELLELLRSLLESSGYRVLTAKDGAQAIDLFEQNSEDLSLVISDIELPHLGGLDAIKRMKQTNANVRLVLASGYVYPEIKTKLELVGVDAFLPKPYVPEEILEMIRGVLDSRKLSMLA